MTCVGNAVRSQALVSKKGAQTFDGVVVKKWCARPDALKRPGSIRQPTGPVAQLEARLVAFLVGSQRGSSVSNPASGLKITELCFCGPPAIHGRICMHSPGV